MTSSNQASAHPALPYLDKLDPWSSHALIGAWLAELPPGTRVLDVGTASGTLGRLCAGRNLALFGLEPEPAWAELARPAYREVRVARLENAPDDYLQDYTVVVCADILEHLAEPGPALRRLVRLQGEAARFYISLPNVANLWVRLSLLAGRFDYAERGILDRTHLRFFTRRSMLALLAESGLQPERLVATPVPLPLVSPWFARPGLGQDLYGLLARLTRILPTLLGYQFVVKAKVARHG